MTTIGQRIKFYRSKNGLSQAALAEKLSGITGEQYGKHLISFYETGSRKVPVHLIRVFAKVLGIGVERLLYSEEELGEVSGEGNLASRLKDALDRIAHLEQTVDSLNNVLKEKEDMLSGILKIMGREP